MGLEAATYIHELDSSNPVGAVDPKAQGDDHIRMIKAALQATFPNIAGAVTKSHTQLNAMAVNTGFAAPTVKIKATGIAGAGIATTTIRTDAQWLLDLTDIFAWTGQHSWNDSLHAPNGSLGAPSYSFSSDVNTGMRSVIPDTLALTAGGVDRFFINADSAFITDGTSANPGLAFNTDVGLGIWRIGANQLGVSVAGVNRLTISTGGFTFALLQRNVDGTVGIPSISFSGDTDSGLYRVGSNQVGMSVGGVLAMQWWNNAGVGMSLLDSGTAAIPGLAFSLDADTGLYLIGSNALGFTEGGAGFRIGYRNVPRSTTATTLAIADVGKCVAVSAAINIPASVFSAGDCISIYNDSAASVNITVSAGTLRFAGTTTTGTRALAARGMATLWFNTGGATPEIICSGAGVS